MEVTLALLMTKPSATPPSTSTGCERHSRCSTVDGIMVPFMNTTLVAALCLLTASACDFHVQTAPSNFPDSGAICADGGPGSGTAVGDDGFTVGSASEKFQELVNNDSGVVTDRSIFISLSSEAGSCGQSATRAGAQLGLSLFDSSGVYGPGDYVAGSQQLAAPCACTTGADGGRGALVVLAWGDGGTRLASSGVVRLTSFEACSLSGTFDLHFTEPDGGDAGSLSGTFQPTYCPQ